MLVLGTVSVPPTYTVASPEAFSRGLASETENVATFITPVVVAWVRLTAPSAGRVMVTSWLACPEMLNAAELGLPPPIMDTVPVMFMVPAAVLAITTVPPLAPAVKRPKLSWATSSAASA